MRPHRLLEDPVTLRVQRMRTPAEMAIFLAVPQQLDGGHPMFTPELRQDTRRVLSPANPLWQPDTGAFAAFVAFRGVHPVGRILAHVHHASNRLHQENVGFFGMFACINDEATARALLQAARDYHSSAGRPTLRGPYDLVITQCIGAVSAGHDEPATFSQIWHPPHIAPLLARCGLTSVYQAATFRLDDVAAARPDTWLGPKHRALLARPNVRLRSWDMRHFAADMHLAMRLTNAAFVDNHGFVPLSAADVEFIAAAMRRIARPELTVFVEVGGVAVGVGMFLPDFHVSFRRMGGSLYPLGWLQFMLGARRLDAAVAQFVAVDPAYQNQGLMRVVLAELMRRLQQAGFRSLDTTWVGSNNAGSLASVRAIGMRQKHALVVFEQATC